MDSPRGSQDIPGLPVFFPVMTKERFAILSGLAEGVVQGMIEKGHLPSVKIGRYRLINLVVLAIECHEYGCEPGTPSGGPAGKHH